ncbi:MAG: chitobiase/beta-hexosaminidase C-terminal domain-containing protein [Candidatus Niyogibacteria bacterium]|nr:chitobiase/beta-hexosaminidase C-terminal domain-containing protein [Candidatus Niyogibacteria bacterium]
MNQFSNKNSKTRKILAGILLLIILFSASSFYPRQAKAETPVADWFMRITSASGWASAIANYAKEAAEKAANIATATFRKMILDMIVDEIIAWISGEGTSTFDTGDWGQFFDKAAQQAGGISLEEITGPAIMQQLCDADWAGQVRLALQTPKKFAQKARCTLRDIGVNFDAFMDNFENGGWAAWIKISESQNNPYGYFLSAVNEKLAKETQKKLGLEKELTASGGFLSDKVCRKISCQTRLKIAGTQEAEYKEETGKWKEDEIPIKDGTPCTCEKWETLTPGKTMADSLSKTVFKDVDWLNENSEWYNYVVAIGDAIVNRLTKEGVKAIKSAVPRGLPTSVSQGVTGKVDYTPPLTSAKIIDVWQVKLTANEPGDTYYTLDGTKPRVRASPKYNGKALTIISSTAPGAATAQLKWLSVDDAFNTEDPRSLPVFLRSPFNYSTLTAYLASQDISIPESIKEALIKFFRDEENGKEAAKIAKETFIPANIREDLKNYLKIEDLRIQLGKESLINPIQRSQLDAILATYEDFNSANDGKLTDLINVLIKIKEAGIKAFIDIQTHAEEIKDRRNNLQSILSYLNGVIASLEICSKAQAAAVIREGETAEEFAVRIAVESSACQKNAKAGAFPVNLNGLSSGLATDPLFSELKDKTDKIILERSLFTIDPAGNWSKPSAALAPTDSGHAAILSFNPLTDKPTAIFFKQSSWETANDRSAAVSLRFNNQINGFYYKQALAVPSAVSSGGTEIWYGAIDAAGNWTEEKTTQEFNADFTDLPPLTDFVKPIAEIKNPVKGSDGYFILDPSLSVDFDSTPRISGYEWDFINNRGATTTTQSLQYEWEAFDLNRDGIFTENNQCLYNFYLNNNEGTVVTGMAGSDTYYVNNDNTRAVSGSLSQKYYDAAHSSPYNKAPNTRPLYLNLQPTCLKNK